MTRLLGLYVRLGWERIAWWCARARLNYRRSRHRGRRFLPEIEDGVDGRVVYLRPGAVMRSRKRRA